MTPGRLRAASTTAAIAAAICPLLSGLQRTLNRTINIPPPLDRSGDRTTRGPVATDGEEDMSGFDLTLRGLASRRRPLRGLLHRSPERVPPRVDAAPDAEGRRLRARARGRRRLQAFELDDAADGG